MRALPLALREADLERSDKDVIERLLWTAAQVDELKNGRQARRWLFVLARRMYVAERRFGCATVPGAGRVAIERAMAAARSVARRFGASDVPSHLVAIAEFQRKPMERWEHVSWWSGTAKASHVEERRPR